MIDTHAHLQADEYDSDRDKVVARFFAQGGKAMINIGADANYNRKALEISETYENVFATLGFHPTEAILLTEEQIIKEIESKIQHKKVVSIGEIGLDYSRKEGLESKERQEKLFQLQLNLAKKYNKSVVIHCREANDEVLKIISQAEFRDLKMVMHCYGGDLIHTEKLLLLPDMRFSFAGNITFTKGNERAYAVIERLPLEKIMLETDCPFLAPMPNRGKRNEPVYVRFVSRKIAQIKQISFEEVERITDQNAMDFFNLKI